MSTQKELSLEEALRIQEELYTGFKDADFQQKLAALEVRHTKGSDEFLAARAALFLTVQRKVLPKYGFEASQNGVVEMLSAAAQFNRNKDYSEKRDKLNQLLGLLPSSRPAEPKPKKTLDQIRRESTLCRLAQRSGRMTKDRVRNKSGIAGGSVLAGAALGVSALRGNTEEDEDNEPEPDRSDSPPQLISGDDVEVLVREAFGDDSLTVVVSSTATYMDVREAISKDTGMRGILSKGHFVKMVNEKYQPFRNDEPIGDERELALLDYQLG